MRALDSNVLVRYLVGDDRRQFAIAEQILGESTQAEEPLFVPVLVLCETMWVLDRVYRQSKSQIIEAIDAILQMDLLVLEHHRLVRHAFEQFRYGKADFADYLIGQIATHAGCRDTVTFDKALKNAPGFTIL